MDLEARRVELEQMVRERFLNSPESWNEGWETLASLYEAGEVYAATMAGKVLANNMPKGATPPGCIAIFTGTLLRRRVLQHIDEGHTYGIDGHCTAGHCRVKVADTRDISKQDYMVFEAIKELRAEADKRYQEKVIKQRQGWTQLDETQKRIVGGN